MCTLCYDLSLYPGELVSGNLIKVFNLSSEATTKWCEVGLELGLNYSQLEVIRVNNQHDVKLRFMQTLNDWLNRADPPPTWEALIEALKADSVGLPAVAKTIEKACAHVEEATPSAGQLLILLIVNLHKWRK